MSNSTSTLNPGQLIVASFTSIGTAATMAFMGILLARMQIVTPKVKRSLSMISMYVTIPCLFFTGVMDCKQDGSKQACPDLGNTIAQAWILLPLPLAMSAADYYWAG